MKAEEKPSGKQSVATIRIAATPSAEGPSSRPMPVASVERQKENRKQRNNRFASTEPSLTRESSRP
ncbi:MAG: hypothetical protein ACLVKA_06770 [Collinsella aerofaciens]